MSQEYREVAEKSALLHIGKNGVNPNLIQHLETLFKKKKLLKIKVMSDTANLLGMEEILTQLIKHLQVYVYDVRGFTAILSKRNIPELKPKKKYLLIRKDYIIPSENTLEKEEDNNKEEEIVSTTDGKSSDSFNDDDDSHIPMPPETKQSYEDAPYIDYDDEDGLVKIDRLSDELYGAPPKPHLNKKSWH